MKKTNISGSVAAFIEAAAYVHGIIIFVIVLNFNEADSVSQKLSLIINNQGVFLSAYFIIYILFGISLVFLTISLYKVFKESGSVIASYIFSFGIFWAVLVTATGMIHNISIGYLSEIYSNDPSQAEITYSVLHIITEGIGGGNEIIGGIFTLLVGIANRSTRVFSSTVTYTGIAAGLAGILSTIPQASDISVAIFGLGQIVWFVFIGIGFLKLNK